MKSDEITGSIEIPGAALIDAEVAAKLARRSPSSLAWRLTLDYTTI